MTTFPLGSITATRKSKKPSTFTTITLASSFSLFRSLYIVGIADLLLGDVYSEWIEITLRDWIAHGTSVCTGGMLEVCRWCGKKREFPMFDWPPSKLNRTIPQSSGAGLYNTLVWYSVQQSPRLKREYTIEIFSRLFHCHILPQPPNSPPPAIQIRTGLVFSPSFETVLPINPQENASFCNGNSLVASFKIDVEMDRFGYCLWCKRVFGGLPNLY